MVLDASVLVAMQLRETRAGEFMQKIVDTPAVLVGAPTVCEAAMVLIGRQGDHAALLLNHALRAMEVEVVPFTEEHYAAAASAFLRFGKGRHPAALNYGDCMAYAVASVSGLPLLYTGADFSKTDIASA
jgi:ribonuclease VapC